MNASDLASFGFEKIPSLLLTSINSPFNNIPTLSAMRLTPLEFYVSLFRYFKKIQYAKKRGLAGAAWSDKSEDLTLKDSQVNIS
jgi:hypothetical protein